MAETTPALELHIAGMDCANCALTLERSVAQLNGIRLVQVNFTTATLTAEGDVSEVEVAARVRALGYEVVEPEVAAAPSHAGKKPKGVLGFFQFMWSGRQSRLALLAGLLLAATYPLTLLPSMPVVSWGVLGTHLAIIVVAGYPIARKGVRALLVGKQITIDLLMSIATIGAMLIGETGEAATVIVLFAFGEALEGYTADRARDSLRSLLALAPDQATILRPCMDCEEHIGHNGYTDGPCPFCGVHETTIAVTAVALGDIALVRPGERIPVDGKVKSGNSSVNQAPITGESIPVSKQPGDAVFAGTINQEGALEIAVTRAASDSTISQIVRLVEQAQAKRSPIERFVDRFARWYTPAVVAAAVLVAGVPPLVFGAPFFDTPDGTRGWLYRALALLIVACPCALVISTPVTMVSALTALARRGILVKGGQYLDAIARTSAFAFDKTGTLTEGKPVVVEVRGAACGPSGVSCEECDEMLAAAAAVERRSEHPLGRAIVAEAEQRGLSHRYQSAESVQALAGRGVQGMVGGDQIVVGSHTLFHEEYDECSGLHPFVEQAEASGQTVMLVSRNRRVLGFVSVADTPRATSSAAMHQLKASAPGARTVMLTGDNPTVAASIAARIRNIDDIRASLLPGDKRSAIEALEAEYGQVAMIGDGVNDAPALAAATVGVAMGGAGTAQAMETADIVLMQDDLTHLPDLVDTSRRARRIIQQNIVFSLAIKAIFLILTLPGWATLWMAVFADMGASLLVTLNGMRMLRNARRRGEA